MTMTTKARISTGSPMPTCTDCSAPTMRAGKTGQRRAQRKHHGVERADVDAERADHLAVGFAGADAHAEPRLGDQQIEAEGDGDADTDDGEAIERVMARRRAARQRPASSGGMSR